MPVIVVITLNNALVDKYINTSMKKYVNNIINACGPCSKLLIITITKAKIKYNNACSTIALSLYSIMVIDNNGNNKNNQFTFRVNNENI